MMGWMHFEIAVLTLVIGIAVVLIVIRIFAGEDWKIRPLVALCGKTLPSAFM